METTFLLAHNRYQGLRSRLPGVDDRGNFGRRVPRRYYPTISYPSDKNTHPNNTPSGGHSETIYPKRIVQFELTGSAARRLSKQDTKLMGREGARAGCK